MKLFRQFSIRSFILTWLLLQFLFIIYLVNLFPLHTPITDDWLYQGIGLHQEKMVTSSIFELINGHQQVLVKIVVWLLGTLPISYLETFWIVNVLLVLCGTYFLVMSCIANYREHIRPYQVLLMLLLLCNYKALYLYLSITGMGICITYFLYGLYFYSQSNESASKARRIQLACAFIAPFTTGFGISLTVFHLIKNAVKLMTKKSPNVKYEIGDIVTLALSLMSSYVLPTILGEFNKRVPGHSSETLTKIKALVVHPLDSLKFVFGLFGSVLTPSSRFDPHLPIMVGLVASLIVIYFFVTKRGRLSSNLLLNLLDKSPFVPAIVFVLLLLVFRGSDGSKTILDSTAPRYVMGTSLIFLSLFSFMSACLKSSLRRDRILSVVLAGMMCISATGTKTGIEWLKVRSKQSQELSNCLAATSSPAENCVKKAWIIREGDSDVNQVRGDLTKFLYYQKA